MYATPSTSWVKSKFLAFFWVAWTFQLPRVLRYKQRKANLFDAARLKSHRVLPTKKHHFIQDICIYSHLSQLKVAFLKTSNTSSITVIPYAINKKYLRVRIFLLCLSQRAYIDIIFVARAKSNMRSSIFALNSRKIWCCKSEKKVISL